MNSPVSFFILSTLALFMTLNKLFNKVCSKLFKSKLIYTCYAQCSRNRRILFGITMGVSKNLANLEHGEHILMRHAKRYMNRLKHVWLVLADFTNIHGQPAKTAVNAPSRHDEKTIIAQNTNNTAVIQNSENKSCPVERHNSITFVSNVMCLKKKNK